MMQIPGLYVAGSTGRDRGVFTATELHKGDMIEICPVVLISKEELENINQTKLYDYYFLWDQKQGNACLPLGFGCIYNHSSKPNAEVELDFGERLMYVKCLEDIKPENEIFIDYLAGANEGEKLWFNTN